MEEARTYANYLGWDFTTFHKYKTYFSRSKQDGKIKDFAEEIGKNRFIIYRRLYLLFLPEEIQTAVETYVATERKDGIPMTYTE